MHTYHIIPVPPFPRFPSPIYLYMYRYHPPHHTLSILPIHQILCNKTRSYHVPKNAPFDLEEEGRKGRKKGGACILAVEPASQPRTRRRRGFVGGWSIGVPHPVSQSWRMVR